MEKGWLIELQGEGVPYYFTTHHDTMCFTADPHEAIRFCRRIDAVTMTQTHFFTGMNTKISEHAWVIHETVQETV